MLEAGHGEVVGEEPKETEGQGQLRSRFQAEVDVWGMAMLLWHA